MKQEDKELLLKDLCARLPYKIIVKVNDTQGIMDEIDVPNERIFVSSLNPFLYGEVKASWFTVNGDKIYPYLRPMSSMSEEEFLEYHNIKYSKVTYRDKWKRIDVGKFHNIGIIPIEDYLDWLNAHHFDYRGLIPMGLALEALEGMYNINEK